MRWKKALAVGKIWSHPSGATLIDEGLEHMEHMVPRLQQHAKHFCAMNPFLSPWKIESFQHGNNCLSSSTFMQLLSETTISPLFVTPQF